MDFYDVGILVRSLLCLHDNQFFHIQVGLILFSLLVNIELTS